MDKNANMTDWMSSESPEGEREMAIIEEVVAERERQILLSHGGNTEKFDMQNTQNDWVAYICAYAGRAADKCKRNESEGCSFRTNMIKVAALAVAAIEAYDKKQEREQ